jgi:hypothetical protein
MSEQIENQEKRIGIIPEPPRKIDYVPMYEMDCDLESAYQKYCIKYNRSETNIFYIFDKKYKDAYKKFSFLGKIYPTDDFDHPAINYIKINVYDNFGSEKALQNVLCFLEDNGVSFKIN